MLFLSFVCIFVIVFFCVFNWLLIVFKFVIKLVNGLFGNVLFKFFNVVVCLVIICCKELIFCFIFFNFVIVCFGVIELFLIVFVI